MAFNYYRNITIDSSKVDSTLTNYPVMVKLDSTNFDFTSVRSDGYDIVFKNSDGTSTLKHEIEYFDNTEEKAVYHVKIPSISSSTDTAFRMYYGDSSITTDQSDSENVWDSNFITVNHMGSSLEDSTSNGFDGTNYGTTLVDGLNGKGRSFDGVNDYITIGNVLGVYDNSQALTFQAMVNYTDSTYSTIVNNQLTGPSGHGYNFGTRNFSPNYHMLRVQGVDRLQSDCTITSGDGEFNLICSTYDGLGNTDSINNIVNNSAGNNLVYSGSGDSMVGNNMTHLGSRIGSETMYGGIIEEVRISDIVRSDAWIKADDYNLRLDTLALIGAEQNVGILAEITGFSNVSYFGNLSYEKLWVLLPEGINSGGDFGEVSVAKAVNPAGVEPGLLFGELIPVSVFGRKLYIDGVNFDLIKWSVEDNINARRLMNCSVRGAGVEIGDPVNFFVSGIGLLIAGVVTQRTEYEYKGNLFSDLTIADNSALADKRIVAESIVNEYAGDIVRDVLLPILSEEGVSEGGIDDGIVIKKANFNYISVAAALDLLKDQAGFHWYVDKYKRLYFKSREEFVSPFRLDDNLMHKDFKRKSNNFQYRNTQYIRAGKGKTATQEFEKPAPKPDGVSRVFDLRYPLAQKPQIFINSVEVDSDDVGVNGLDTGKKWYFTYNSDKIAQDQLESVLGDTDLLEVTYIGFFDIVSVASNPDEIYNRKEKESGSSGIYERLHEDKTIDDTEQAVDYANALVLKYGEITDSISFKTEVDGLRAGQILPVSKSLFGLTGDYLIEKIVITPKVDNVEYNVKALDGSAVGGWENFFKDILRQSRTFSISENEVLIYMNAQVETSKAEVRLSVLIYDALFPTLFLYPEESLYPNNEPVALSTIDELSDI